MLEKENVEENNIHNSLSEETSIEEKYISHARKDNQWTNKRRYGFQQRQRIVIAYKCGYVYGELYPDQCKSFNLRPKII